MTPDAAAGVAALVALLDQRRFAEVEKKARKLRKKFPKVAAVSKILALALVFQERLEDARRAFAEHLKLDPNDGESHNNFGIVLQKLGRAAEAEASFRRAVALRPEHPDAHGNLAIVLRRLGRLDEAEANCRRALALSPRHAGAHNNLGNILRERGQLAEAEASFRRAVEVDPVNAEAWSNLGIVVQALDRVAEAEACHRRALAANPNYAEAHNNLAVVLTRLGRLDEAENHARRALALKPDFAAAHATLGGVLEEKGLLAEAESAYRRALAANGTHVEAMCGLGNVRRGTGGFEEASSLFRRALELNPEYPLARFGLGVNLLARPGGDWREGWAGYEARWDVAERESARPVFRGLPGVPVWSGTPLGGERLFVFAEQGVGDQIQFARFLPRIQGAGGLVVQVLAPLVRLFRSSFAQSLPGATFVPRIEDANGPFDAQIALGGLPRALGVTRESLGTAEPYLRAEDAAAATWAKRLPGDGRASVGIAWRGNPEFKGDRWRSIPLAAWSGLLAKTAVRWVSLQKDGQGLPAEEAEFLARWGVTDAMADAADFADTAALISNLDLVIAVDTAVVHLAGAMGKPAWLLNRATSEWRWGWKEAASPWYPTMRIFNQERLGDWQDVFGAVAEELGRFER